MAANVKRARRRDDDDGGTISDGRVDLPIFIHSIIDDFGLTPPAFRVYAHLVRRANGANRAWPSYRAIGEHCFGSLYAAQNKVENGASLRRMAMRAITELLEHNMIRREHRLDERGLHSSNEYILTPPNEWIRSGGGDSQSLGVVTPGHQGGDPQSLGVVTPGHQGGDPQSPKGTPIKVIHSKVLQLRDGPAQKAPATFGDSTAGGVAASATAAADDVATGSDDPRANLAHGDDGGGDDALSGGGVDDLALALSEVCGMAWDVNAGRLRREAGRLSAAADPVPSADLVREHYGAGGWWWSGDWRGAKGDLPSPANIRETWGRWALPGPAGNGRGGNGRAADPLAGYEVPAGYEHLVKH